MKNLCALFATIVALGWSESLAGDVAGSKDDPALKRIEGSEILYYKASKFDACRFALKKVQFDYAAQDFKETKTFTVEGPRTIIYYKLPPETSTLEGIRQYETELKAKGYERLFEAADDGWTTDTTGSSRRSTRSEGQPTSWTMSTILIMTTSVTLFTS